MINVLVTGVGSLLAQGILRCLKTSSVPCKVYGTDYFPNAIGLYWVHKGFILPDLLKPGVSRQQWLVEVLAIIRQYEIDIVFVGLDFEVLEFAQHREFIESNSKAKVIVASPEVVDICKDKYKTANFLKAHGFPYPASCLPAEIEGFLNQHDFPLIVKPRFGFRSRHLSVVHDRLELDTALKDCPMPVIQQLVGEENEEYTCGSLCLGGKLINTIALRRYLKDGNTIRAQFDEECRTLHDFVGQVALAIKGEGPLNFQLRRTSQGPVIFEINPRFSGTTYMRALFGANEVAMIINALLLKKPYPAVQLRHGVALRYFEDQFIPLNQYQRWGRP